MFVDSRFLDLWLDMFAWISRKCAGNSRMCGGNSRNSARNVQNDSARTCSWFFYVLLIFNVIVHPWGKKWKNKQQETVNPGMAGKSPIKVYQVHRRNHRSKWAISQKMFDELMNQRITQYLNWWTKRITQYLNICQNHKSFGLWLSMAPSLWEKASSG